MTTSTAPASLYCQLCGHTWAQRSEDLPAKCPACRRRGWRSSTAAAAAVERIREAGAQEQVLHLQRELAASARAASAAELEAEALARTAAAAAAEADAAERSAAAVEAEARDASALAQVARSKLRAEQSARDEAEHLAAETRRRAEAEAGAAAAAEDLRREAEARASWAGWLAKWSAAGGSAGLVSVVLQRVLS